MALHHSLRWNALKVGVVVPIEIVGLAVLARLLLPEEMGRYAAAFALLQLAMLIGSFGLQPVIVRAEAVTTELRRQVVAVSLTATTLVFGLLVLMLSIGNAVGAGFGSGSGSGGLLAIMLPALFFTCFGTLANFEFVRTMRFREIFFARLSATLLFPGRGHPNGVVRHGPGQPCGRVSRVEQPLCHPHDTLVRRAFPRDAELLPGGWRPVLCVDHLDLPSPSASDPNLLDPADRTVDGVCQPGLLLARQRPRAAGQSRRRRSHSASPHALPVRAARNQEALSPLYLRALGMVGSTCLPLAAVLCVLAGPIVRILLGNQWLESIMVLAVLAPICGLVPLTYVALTIAVAQYRERLEMAQSAGMLVLTLTIVAVTAPHGLVAVSAGLTAAQLISFVVAVLVSVHLLRIPLSRVLGSLVPGVLMTAVAVAPGMIAAQVLPVSPAGDAARIAITLTGAALFWFAAVFMLRNPITKELRTLISASLGIGRNASE